MLGGGGLLDDLADYALMVVAVAFELEVWKAKLAI